MATLNRQKPPNRVECNKQHWEENIQAHFQTIMMKLKLLVK